MLRNRRFVRELDPGKTSLEDKPVTRDQHQVPISDVSKKRKKRAGLTTSSDATDTWSPSPAPLTTSTGSAPPPPSLSPSFTPTSSGIPPVLDTVEDLPTLALPEQVPALGGDLVRGQDVEAGHAPVADDRPVVAVRRKEPPDRPVCQRKPNVRYSANEYDLSSIRTRSQRTIRRAM